MLCTGTAHIPRGRLRGLLSVRTVLVSSTERGGLSTQKGSGSRAGVRTRRLDRIARFPILDGVVIDQSHRVLGVLSISSRAYRWGVPLLVVVAVFAPIRPSLSHRGCRHVAYVQAEESATEEHAWVPAPDEHPLGPEGVERAARERSEEALCLTSDFPVGSASIGSGTSIGSATTGDEWPGATWSSCTHLGPRGPWGSP